MRPIYILIQTTLLFISLNHHAQERSVEDWMSAYEREMGGAVQSWKDGQFGSALDRMRTARDLIGKNIPQPSDEFRWHASRSIKTYTLLLIRLVEFEMSEKDKKSESAQQSVRQIYKWGEKLIEQAKVWGSVEAESDENEQLRKNWFRRYRTALDRVKKLSQKLDKKQKDS